MKIWRLLIISNSISTIVWSGEAPFPFPFQSLCYVRASAWTARFSSATARRLCRKIIEFRSPAMKFPFQSRSQTFAILLPIFCVSPPCCLNTIHLRARGLFNLGTWLGFLDTAGQSWHLITKYPHMNLYQETVFLTLDWMEILGYCGILNN